MPAPFATFSAASDASFTITVLDPATGRIPDPPLSSSDTLAAVAWAGPGQAPLFSPVVAWIDPTASTISLRFPASATTALDPGIYSVRVSLTTGGANVELFTGQFELTPGPAAGAPTLATRCSLQDMLLYGKGALRKLASAPETAGFLAERARARNYFDAVLHRRRRPMAGAAFRTTAPYIQLPVTSVGQRDPYLQSLLDWDKAHPGVSLLVLTDEVVEAHARLALAFAMGGTLDGEKGENAYERLAARHMARAENLLASITVEVLANPTDTYPSIVIDLGTLTTRSGMARW